MASFGRLTDLVKNTLELQASGVFLYVFDNEKAESYIVKLNLAQLYSGVDAEGRELEDIGGEYSNFTVDEKLKKGQPFDRVTLKDTGAFYNSFFVSVAKEDFIIEADYIKDGDDLRKRWGKNLAGLTTESKKKLITFIIPSVREYILKKMLAKR